MMMMMMMMTTTRLQIVPINAIKNPIVLCVNSDKALVEFCLLCLTDDEGATHQNDKLSQNVRNPQIMIR
jgi:hypothetical protein